MPRNRSKRSRSRRAVATEAIKDLECIMLNNYDTDISNSAASLILRIGKKHGIRRSGYYGFSICRKCKKALIPGINYRLRIRSKSLKKTRLDCEEVRTLGPSFVRD